MKVIVDGKSVDLPLEGQNTIGDVVGLVSSDLDTKRRIIRVIVDGQDITGQAEAHMQAKNGLETIEITTGLASDLALETLDGIKEFHNALELELNRAADEFRMGNTLKSNEMFARCVDGLQILLRTTISVANLLQVDSKDIQAGPHKMSDVTQNISKVLEELISAQVNRDSILIADLIEYELKPLLDDWQDAREQLRRIGKAA
jgi:hypothetical protein